MSETQACAYVPSEQLVIIVGNYGSGKTEVAVNLALCLVDAGNEVHIADLDIVNPYFRSREARALMEWRGIRVVIPPGEQVYADLPIVLPEIKGMLQPAAGVFSLFDVGGDDVGARMLSSLREPLGALPYALLQVINSRRPFTGTVEGCLKMQRSIESASRLAVTGYVVNSHLIEQTTVDVVIEGYDLARAVSARSGVPIALVSAMGDLARHPAVVGLHAPILALERIMLPPWLRRPEKHDSASLKPDDLPAARARPIGKP
jgi:hypothetical protein